MLRIKTLLAFSFVFALSCKREHMPSQPPQLQNHAAELLQYDRTPDVLKPNPRPAAWMPGCYSIVEAQLTESEYPQVPRLFELTLETLDTGTMRQSYRVRSVDDRVKERMWRWHPVSSTQLELVFSDGFCVWDMILAEAAHGLSGRATWGSDVPGNRKFAPAHLVRVSCVPK